MDHYEQEISEIENKRLLRKKTLEIGKIDMCILRWFVPIFVRRNFIIMWLQNIITCMKYSGKYWKSFFLNLDYKRKKKNGTMNFWPYYFYKFNNEMRVGEDQFILVINEFEAGNIENRNWIIIIN